MAQSVRGRSRPRSPAIDSLSTLRLTILGSSSSIPRPNRACSSYLLEDGTSKIVLDLGTGAFANMRLFTGYTDLDAVVISHMHADHFIDIIPMRYALKYGQRHRDGRLPLYLPPDGDRMLRELVASFAREGAEDFLDEVFDIRIYQAGEVLRFGDATLRFAPTQHYITAYAARYESDGHSITYSADTAPDERVVELARGSDFFICEASLLPHEIEGELRGHSSAREAAEMARAAGVAHLVLTHYSNETTREEMIAQARAVFDGVISVADDNVLLTADQ